MLADEGVAGFVEFAAAGFRLPDGRSLLTDLSLTVAEGETLALIGRSGSGKTTALKLVNALLLPTVGRVQVDGKPTTAWDPIRLRRRTGWVIQDVGLFEPTGSDQRPFVGRRLEARP